MSKHSLVKPSTASTAAPVVLPNAAAGPAKPLRSNVRKLSGEPSPWPWTTTDGLDRGPRRPRFGEAPTESSPSVEGTQARDAAVTAVLRDGLALADVSPLLKGDRELVRMAVAQDAKAFRYAAPELRADPVFVEVLTSEHPAVLDSARLRGEQKAEIAARVLERAGSARIFKDPNPTSIYVRLMARDDFAQRVIGKNRTLARPMVAYLGDRAADFFEPLVERDPLLLACIGKKATSEILDRQPDLARAYTELTTELETLGIANPDRIPDIDVLREIVSNRQFPERADPRPTAIVITPTRDRVQAFTVNDIRELTRAYRVMYYEVATDGGFYEAVRDATANEKASALIIGGHGSATRLAFGGDDPAERADTDETMYLDFSDRAEMLEANLGGRMAAGSKVIVDSCNTGEGRNTRENIVNLVADVFTSSTVYGPVGSTNMVLEFGPDGLLSHPRFLWNVACYTVER